MSNYLRKCAVTSSGVFHFALENVYSETTQDDCYIPWISTLIALLILVFHVGKLKDREAGSGLGMGCICNSNSATTFGKPKLSALFSVG